MADVEKAAGRPVFATLANDYQEVTQAILGERLVAPNSAFAEGVRGLARKLSGLPETPRASSKFALLSRLGRVMD